MIPKVIHYCWFGRNPKSEIIQKCIASWKEFCPDYEIIEWNEDNFDVNSIPYTAAAYADKKWAYVSDYARLKIVYENGGIYLDTDVLLHNSLDELLQYECWLASDDVRYVNTGLGFGAEEGQWLVGELMRAYHAYSFNAAITCVTKDTEIIVHQLPQWKKSDRTRCYDRICIIGLRDYGEYAKHLYTYSWADEKTAKERLEKCTTGELYSRKQRWMYKVKCVARNPAIVAFFDKRKGSRLECMYTFCAYDLLDYGLFYFLKKLVRKIIK